MRRIPASSVVARYAMSGAPYVIGVLAAFWFFERLATFWA
jgi:hypothetical protein